MSCSQDRKKTLSSKELCEVEDAAMEFFSSTLRCLHIPIFSRILSITLKN